MVCYIQSGELSPALPGNQFGKSGREKMITWPPFSSTSWLGLHKALEPLALARGSRSETRGYCPARARNTLQTPAPRKKKKGIKCIHSLTNIHSTSRLHFTISHSTHYTTSMQLSLFVERSVYEDLQFHFTAHPFHTPSSSPHHHIHLISSSSLPPPPYTGTLISPLVERKKFLITLRPHIQNPREFLWKTPILEKSKRIQALLISKRSSFPSHPFPVQQ